MFNQEDLHPLLDSYSPTQLDDLDFGVVRINDDGIVQHMNTYEANLAKMEQDSASGKHFFTQIAPCTNNFMVAEKYQKAQAVRDEMLDYVFTYLIKPTKVKLRLLIDPTKDFQYLLVKWA